MLEQQDSADCDYGGATKPNNNNVDNNTPQVSNNGEVNGDLNGLVGQDTTTTTAPTASNDTTTVRIHTTYKKRASKFMNRPNVQNGLGGNSLLNPYGVSGAGGSNTNIALAANIGGTNRLYNCGSQPRISSLISRVTNSQQNRSLATTSSLFGGVSSGGGGIPSPQGTTTGSTTTTTVESRPPFVTTVTRGRFLPSKFDLMVEKSLFTFSSRPKPVGLITRHQCSLSGGPLKENNNQNCQPRGAHDYFNVMWDPHVFRGTTTTITSSLKQADTDLISSRDHERHRRRRAFLAGGGNNVAGSNGNVAALTPSNNVNRSRYRMTTKVSSRARTFPPPEGRHQVHVQTEQYLEDMSRDVITSRGPEVDKIVQTDPIEDEEILSSTLAKGGVLPEFKSGVDASTQVLPGELYSFEERVQPVVEAVVGKILEQALLETMEEEEIGALKAQQNRFLEKRKEEERELKRLQEQQERISAEKERLKRHLEIQLARQGARNGDEVLSPLSSPLLLGDGSGNMSEIGGGTNLASGMSTSYLLELLPSVINSLRQEGFITDQMGDGALSSYLPLWASSSSKHESSNGEPAIDPDDDEDFSNPFPDGYHSRANSFDNPPHSTSDEQHKDLDLTPLLQVEGDIETNPSQACGDEANKEICEIEPECIEQEGSGESGESNVDKELLPQPTETDGEHIESVEEKSLNDQDNSAGSQSLPNGAIPNSQSIN